jgi:glutamyl-tRNA reductase
VGYGKVGQRKHKFLQASGVSVKVIAPDVSLPKTPVGSTQCLKRKFKAGDSKGAFVVFACTDDKHVNREVLEDARRHNVPCCCADQNWADADFTTPAVARGAGISVAVSTSGASCASAKEMRRSLESFLSGRESGKVVVIGTSDGYTSSDRRAAFHLSPESRKEMVRFLYGIKGVESLVVLNTCSRVEVALYGSVDIELVKRLMQFHRLNESEYFILEGADAFRHVVLVTAGLKSAWAGEFHVVSQVKDALDESLERGMLNGRLKGFFDSALRAAKKVRRAVSGILEVKEIEATALDYISSKMDLDSARVVVLGSGKIGSAAAEMLKGCNVRVVHHGERIPHCDALICALSAQSPVVKRPRKGCVIVDLGMPPNCAPSAGAVSLDDLKNWRRAQTGAIDEAMALAEDVVASELKKSRICR